LGLSLWEIGFLAFSFVAISQLTSFTRFHTLIAAAFVLFVATLLKHLNKRFEKNFILRLIRFCSLPARLHRELISEPQVRQEKSHVKI